MTRSNYRNRAFSDMFSFIGIIIYVAALIYIMVMLLAFLLIGCIVGLLYLELIGYRDAILAFGCAAFYVLIITLIWRKL